MNHNTTCFCNIDFWLPAPSPFPVHMPTYFANLNILRGKQKFFLRVIGHSPVTIGCVNVPKDIVLKYPTIQDFWPMEWLCTNIFISKKSYKINSRYVKSICFSNGRNHFNTFDTSVWRMIHPTVTFFCNLASSPLFLKIILTTLGKILPVIIRYVRSLVFPIINQMVKVHFYKKKLAKITCSAFLGAK